MDSTDINHGNNGLYGQYHSDLTVIGRTRVVTFRSGVRGQLQQVTLTLCSDLQIIPKVRWLPSVGEGDPSHAINRLEAALRNPFFTSVTCHVSCLLKYEICLMSSRD